MKLFYWSYVIALERYSTGYAFAIAETKAQAIKAIYKKFSECTDWDFEYDRGLSLARELYQSDPQVFDVTTGFLIYGSE